MPFRRNIHSYETGIDGLEGKHIAMTPEIDGLERKHNSITKNRRP
jgi:hypothetical protein